MGRSDQEKDKWIDQIRRRLKRRIRRSLKRLIRRKVKRRTILEKCRRDGSREG